MDCPKVSIIIATFNAAKTLSVALESVHNQTYKDYECLIVDGNSRDDTIRIARDYSEQDIRFRYISEPDKGIFDAFNKGWKMAQGEWVMYLGADDYYFPDGVEKLMAIATDEVDIVYGDCELRFNRTRKIRGNSSMEAIGYKLPACHQSMAMKRSLFETLGGFDLNYKVYGDLDIIQRGYIIDAHFAVTNDVISSFYVGGVSADNLAALSELYSIMKKNKIVKHPRIKIVQLAFHAIIFKIYHLFK